MLPDSRLDNPIWHALHEAHAQFREEHMGAVRYAPDVAYFAAMESYSESGFRDLTSLAPPGGTQMMLTRRPLEVPESWRVDKAIQIGQMVCEEMLAEPGEPGEPLGEADVPAMLELVAKTEPGPFLPRTRCMGRYYGIRAKDGRLLSMAGERLAMNGLREVSAVCTDPEFQGHGLARRLMSFVTSQILAEGDVAFLHYHLDRPAKHLYEKLGFRPNGTIEYTILTRYN